MRRHYLSYLLRMWQIDDGGKRAWRASLETPDRGERIGFASPDQLFEFLSVRLVQAEQEGQDDDLADQAK